MNFDDARAVANAVMYEGYILYPYRASAAKNQSRWQFGVVMSPGYAAADPSELVFAQTECVLEHTGQPALELVIRFLQVQRRSGNGPSWDEAVEREVAVAVDAAQLLGGAECVTEFEIAGGEEREGGVVRRREALTGSVSVLASPLPCPWGAARLRVRVDNRTVAAAVPPSRADALPTALIAAHMIIGLHGGAFISMTDPPEWASAGVQACENIGCWPVLAGADGGRQVMLSTPIILYDHPELAAESPGDLYDGTEIDEILSLRTLALSDAEKLQARATDPRAAALIDRVEALGADDFKRMHGTIRSPRVVSGPPDALFPGSAEGPGAPAATSPPSRGGIRPPTPRSPPIPTPSPWPAAGSHAAAWSRSGRGCGAAMRRTCSSTGGRPGSRRCSWTWTTPPTWPCR